MKYLCPLVTKRSRPLLPTIAFALSLALAITLVASASAEEPAPIDTVDWLADYIAAHGESPVDYVLDKFRDHDVVILGEWHYIKDDPLLIQRLIPVLHRHGINTLATEHARWIDQPLIDSLLAAPVYDEKLAMKITFLEYVHWPFREYVDIFRAAWECNHGPDSTLPPFRILGANYARDWSLIHTPEDSDNPDIMRAVCGGHDERDMAQVVLDAVAAGDKVLVFCGTRHGFTHYSQPKLDGYGQFESYERTRMGNYIFDSIGDRVMLVVLHSPWPGPEGYGAGAVFPVDGYIDRAMQRHGRKAYPVGFDVAASPLTQITLSNTYFRQGHEPFTLDKFCDGYIFTRPISEFEPVTLIDGFVTEENLQYARDQTPSPEQRDFDVEKYYEDFRHDLAGLRSDWRTFSLDSL